MANRWSVIQPVFPFRCARAFMKRRVPLMSEVSVSFRGDFSPDCAVGPGKIALLEQIAGSGSLSEAARKLKMSYPPGVAAARGSQHLVSNNRWRR